MVSVRVLMVAISHARVERHEDGSVPMVTSPKASAVTEKPAIPAPAANTAPNLSETEMSIFQHSNAITPQTRSQILQFLQGVQGFVLILVLFLLLTVIGQCRAVPAKAQSSKL